MYLGSSMHYEYEYNDAGADGWELVGIYKDSDSWYAVFKRPKK